MDNCQRIFSPLSTVNYRRSFSVSDSNALTFIAYVVEKNANSQRVTFFSPTTKTYNVYFFKILSALTFNA